MNIGDIVARKSYNCDTWFIINHIESDIAILSGIYYRLLADANLSDLEIINTRNYNFKNDIEVNSREEKINLFKSWYEKQCNSSIYNKKCEENNYKGQESNTNNNKIFGKILHIDGDKSYLKESLRQYKKLGVPAEGININENEQPEKLLNILKMYKPDILVVTGHDSLKKNSDYSTNLDDYTNSKYYVECVKIAREYNKSYDDLVIFAGGCKSNYEAIMEAGANFASSPDRILLHVTDPVIVASNISKASIREILDIDSIINGTYSGIGGIGGVETRGTCREVKPSF